MGLPRLARTCLTALLVVGTVLAGGTAASAYLTTTGSGTAAASLGTLRVPTRVAVPASSSGNVTVTWRASTGSLAPTGYYVTRLATATGVTAAACGTSPASTLLAVSCTDSAVPRGGYTYRVTAVYRTWTARSAPSGSITVTPPLAKLAFTSQPAGATGGVAFTGQPVVALQDAAGQTATENTSPVTLSITGSPAGVALACATNPVQPVSGLAAFSGCRIDRAGSYTLTATAAGFSAVSAAVTVAVGPAAKLAVSAQPTNVTGATGASAGTGGVAFAIQPRVSVHDAGGNTVTGDTRLVSIALAATPSPGAAVPTCTATNAVAGVATFSGCLIDKTGTYALTATATAVTAATTGSFTITVGAAAKIAFTAQPADGTRNVDFAPQPVVAIQDAGGNTVTSGAARLVTLTYTPDAQNNDLTCDTGNTRTTSAGVASFTGCDIKKAGTYQLVASVPGFTVTSTPISVQ